VMAHLQALDPIAYIRFACVYERLKDINDLMETIKLIQPKDDTAPTEVKTKVQKE